MMLGFNKQRDGRECVLEGALLRSKWPKFEADGREEGRAFWGGAASLLPISKRVWGVL